MLRAAKLAAEPIGLGSVTLEPGSRLYQQRAANSDWLLHLEPSRLTCLYTSAANLTCSSTGTPYSCKASAQWMLRPSHPRPWVL